jgi:hypothetical protein
MYYVEGCDVVCQSGWTPFRAIIVFERFERFNVSHSCHVAQEGHGKVAPTSLGAQAVTSAVA